MNIESVVGRTHVVLSQYPRSSRTYLKNLKKRSSGFCLAILYWQTFDSNDFNARALSLEKYSSSKEAENGSVRRPEIVPGKCKPVEIRDADRQEVDVPEASEKAASLTTGDA